MFLHLSRKDREQPMGAKSPGVLVNALTILARYVPLRSGFIFTLWTALVPYHLSVSNRLFVP